METLDRGFEYGLLGKGLALYFQVPTRSHIVL